jgi:hypothetical protein
MAKSVGWWQQLQARIAARLGAGWDLESASVLWAVAAHREYWRPEKVRVLLLAESHVMTRDAELASGLSLAAFGHPEAPPEFVRLVYCLGYGEPGLRSVKVAHDSGTPQFWKLLAACLGDPRNARVLKNVEPDFERRVRARLALLEALRLRGVWLLDASPIALYVKGGGKPKHLPEVLRTAWEEYACAAVREVAPDAVMVIGKMVHSALGERVQAAVGPDVPVDWLYQPQAHVTAAEHADGYARLREMVRRHGAER